MPHHFISYSTADAADFARTLADDLAADGLPVWLDRRELIPGQPWDRQLVDAIRACDSLIFVMTRDNVRDDSVCKQEWMRALAYKKPVVPLRLHADAELPFLLEPRQFIDFSGDVDAALARLRRHLRWLDSPAGRLQALRARLADAERDLARAFEVHERQRVEQEMSDLRRDIAHQEAVVADPDAAARAVEDRIEAGMERERQPKRPVTGERRTKFINPPPLIAPLYFQNRYVETQQIGDFLGNETQRLMTVVGRGGVGKTALVCRLLRALEQGRLPDDGGSLAVDGIVYLSETGAHRISLPNLFADLSKLLPPDTAQRLDALYKDTQVDVAHSMHALLEEFPAGRVVLLLDNLETVVDAETRRIVDEELDAALRTLLAAPHHAVKVLTTTRLAPFDLALHHPERQRTLTLDEGLESPYAEQMLRELDADGSLGLRDAPDALLQRARRRTRGYPRGLEALYAILAADRNSTLAELLADDDGPLPDNVVEALVGEAYIRLDRPAQLVMQALALYNRPVSPAAVDHLLQPTLPGVDAASVLGRLVNMHFARREDARYYLHQIDRTYALAQIPDDVADDMPDVVGPFTIHQLTQRGADYFRRTRLPRAEWRSLVDLEAQLAEFDLRCAAADYDSAAAILDDISFDYLLLWGHARLLVDLHNQIRSELSDSRTSQKSDNILGHAYARLGLMPDAIRCFQRGLETSHQLDDRGWEGTHLGNLGWAYADLGRVEEAIDHYEQALLIAREIGDQQGEGNHRGNLGGAYHRLGRMEEAIDHHQQALLIAREIGDRRGEGTRLGNLGNAYAALGRVEEAIDHYEQALLIAREIGDRRGEGFHLGNLGNRNAELGRVEEAIDQYEQALSIRQEIGDRYGECVDCTNLADRFVDQGKLDEALTWYDRAISIADEILNVQGQSEARSGAARAHLLKNDLSTAYEIASAAAQFDYPTNNAHAQVLRGIINLRQRNSTAAQESFTAAIIAADGLLAHSQQNYAALDHKGLALCGLALCGVEARSLAFVKSQTSDAIAAFRAARAITAAPGIVGRRLQLFDALRVADGTGILDDVRPIAAGKEST